MTDTSPIPEPPQKPSRKLPGLSRDGLDSLVAIGGFAAYSLFFWIVKSFFAPIGYQRTIFLFIAVAGLFGFIWAALQVRRRLVARLFPSAVS